MAWPSKYGSKRTLGSALTDGRSFASQLERGVYLYIKAKEQAGEWTLLNCQEQIHICCNKETCKSPIYYKPDFTVQDAVSKETLYIEAKGFETPEWRLKKRLWAHYGPGRLHIYKGTANNPVFTEEIAPVNTV